MTSNGGAKVVLLKGALLLSSVDGMVASALIVPILANIASAYPDAGPWLNQLLSLPSLLMIPAILITGRLADYISKKALLMTGTLIFIIGGFGGAFADNIMDLVWTRALLGIGCGIVYPMAPAMIAYLYKGQERAQLLGWTNSCGGIFSFILGIGAGYVALINWKYAFYYYLIFILVLMMQAVLLPNFPPEKRDPAIAGTRSQGGVDERLGYQVWLTSFDMLVFMTISMVIIFKLSLFIVNEHIGTSADVGLATSLNTMASFVASLFFVQILRVLKRYTAVFSLICMTLCYFFLSIAHNFIMVVVAVVFLGLSMGTMFPYLMNRISIVAPNAKKTIAISIVSMSIYLGQFLSAFYTQFVDSISGGLIRRNFTFVAITLGVCVVTAIIYIVVSQKREVLKGVKEPVKLSQ